MGSTCFVGRRTGHLSDRCDRPPPLARYALGHTLRDHFWVHVVDNKGALAILAKGCSIVFGGELIVGTTQEWNDRLSSNFTYSEGTLDNLPFQSADDIHRATYLAANVIWSPLERVKLGIEYLYGIRQNIDLRSEAANRVQVAFIFDLP